jgi:hypothetical protein
MTSDMRITNLSGFYGTSSLDVVSHAVIVTDGPHRLITTTPIPLNPTVVGASEDTAEPAKRSAPDIRDLGTPER